MNSLQLTRHLHESGMLSKEAALRVLSVRQDLVKQATEEMTKQAIFGLNPRATATTAEAAKAVASGPRSIRGSSALMGASARNIAPLLGLAGLIALGSTATKMGLNAVSDIKTKKDLNESFSGMFKEYPDMKEDRGQATKYFKMMSKYAPALASNPIIAGTWVKQMMNMNVVDPKNIAQLMDAQQSWEEIRALKSPLVGFTQEMPGAKTIFEKALVTGDV